MSAASALSARGLDLVHAFPASCLGDLLNPSPSPRALCWLIGNTSALWDVFHKQYQIDTSLHASADPLDAWVERAVSEALADEPDVARVCFGHRPDGQGRYVPLQALARRAGLAALSPAHLSAHPVYGLWWALRALVIFERDGPPPPPPARAPCEGCAAPCVAATERALAGAPAPSAASIRSRWRAWVAARDACPVGRAHRYPDAQLRYHYLGEGL